MSSVFLINFGYKNGKLLYYLCNNELKNGCEIKLNSIRSATLDFRE